MKEKLMDEIRHEFKRENWDTKSTEVMMKLCKSIIDRTRQEAILEGQRIERDNLLSMVDEFHDEIDFEEMAQMVRRVVQHCKQGSTLPVTEK